jgi:hypothetical protein
VVDAQEWWSVALQWTRNGPQVLYGRSFENLGEPNREFNGQPGSRNWVKNPSHRSLHGDEWALSVYDSESWVLLKRGGLGRLLLWMERPGEMKP